MSATIITPLEIEHTFYEGELEFTSESQEMVTRQFEPTFNLSKLSRPVVTLGRPQCWNLADLLQGLNGLVRNTSKNKKVLPPEISLLMQDSDFYLLLLACSFRPERDSQVEWARLTAYLRPKTGQNNPIAFDLYPREVYDETKTDTKISISPSFKFSTIEAKLGDFSTTIEFKKLEPVIIGYGALESAPNWDFEKYKGQFLRGSKFSYMIVKKPHGSEAVRLTLDIVVNVITNHGLLSAKIKDKDHRHLSLITCVD